MSQVKLNEQRNIEMLRIPNVRDIGMGILLLLASRASVLGMFPFGAAFFAACFDKSIAYAGITVISLAMMTTSSGLMLVKYLVASLLFWIYTRFRRRDSLICDATCCGGAVFLGGAVYLLYSFVGVYDVLLLFVEAIVSAIMYIVFKKSHMLIKAGKNRKHTSQDELISTAVSVGVMITGLSGIVLPYGISVSGIAAVYATLFITLNSSLAAAGSGGLCIGFMASMSSPSAVVMMGIFGISALFANLLKAFGKIGVALGFLGGMAVAWLYAGSSIYLPVTLIETGVGALLFLVTPNKIRDYISTFFTSSVKEEVLSSDLRAKEYLAMRLARGADAFKSLSECFRDCSEKRLKSYNKDASAIFDEVADRVCEGCPNFEKCWSSNFTATYRSIMLLLSAVEKNGILTVDNVPQAFREKCRRFELFVVEFNHVYELYKKNLVRLGEAQAQRDIAARQYMETADIMEGLAAEVTAGFTFREDLEEKIVNELDRSGISVLDVKAVEGGHGKIEVYLGTAGKLETEKTENILEYVTETPMMYDCDFGGGVTRFVSKAKYSIDVGVCQVSRDSNDISGDSIDVFRDEDYKQYIIISDGMGSGRRAMLESNITLRLMKEFLQAGFEVNTAIDMINSSMCLRLDYECFSTVDLLCIDLMSGVCEFFKIGGAESIVLHGSNTETVFSVSLPVGMMPEIKVKSQTKKLSDGDTIIMMSDGISEAGFGTVRTEWLKKEIKKPFDTMDDMAQDVIETAVKKSRDAVIDDMTVAAIRLSENI